MQKKTCQGNSSYSHMFQYSISLFLVSSNKTTPTFIDICSSESLLQSIPSALVIFCKVINCHKFKITPIFVSSESVRGLDVSSAWGCFTRLQSKSPQGQGFLSKALPKRIQFQALLLVGVIWFLSGFQIACLSNKVCTLRGNRASL